MESEALSESPWRHLSSDTFDELLFHMEGFVASETFAGARAGRVFKMGELGLGYYKDTWEPRIECLALSSTCKELRLLLLPNFIPQATSMAAELKRMAEQRRLRAADCAAPGLLVLRARQAFKRLCKFVKQNGVLPVTGTLGETAYGKEIKGERVSVLWEGGRWYQGTVKDFNGFDEHLIVYEDGDSRWHNVAEEEAENGVKWL